MKLATWNVNSLKVRLPHVIDWLADNPVDALCLQELKLDQDKFPVAELEAVGYHAAWSGQKTYNGVAILTRAPQQPQDVIAGIPGYDDPQRRLLAATRSLATLAGSIRWIAWSRPRCSCAQIIAAAAPSAA